MYLIVNTKNKIQEIAIVYSSAQKRYQFVYLGISTKVKTVGSQKAWKIARLHTSYHFDKQFAEHYSAL